MSLSVLTNLARSRGSCIVSVCSAHPMVLEAALLRGAARQTPVLIEATCNQVNHEGGYTGLTPAAFHAQVLALAQSCGLPKDLLLLGGDHLGPNPWTSLPAEAALQNAETMMRDYVAAGFTKLHLDTSMACAGDPLALPETTIAERAARLARVAEITAHELGRPKPVYVIGTEVPPPGGARERIETLTPTDPAAAETTLSAHQAAFRALGLEDATTRVIALVVQPGVEFGTDNVVPYNRAAARKLAKTLAGHPGLVFEAHSTDYQQPDRLAELAEDGFAILKVGPALTFALRETLYRLDALAAALDPAHASLADVMERIMLESPRHWQGHCHGDAIRQRLMRHHSYSDRIRYYWPAPKASAAVSHLIALLDRTEVPETLISHFLPAFHDRPRLGPRAMLIAAVQAVLETYPA